MKKCQLHHKYWRLQIYYELRYNIQVHLIKVLGLVALWIIIFLDWRWNFLKAFSLKNHNILHLFTSIYLLIIFIRKFIYFLHAQLEFRIFLRLLKFHLKNFNFFLIAIKKNVCNYNILFLPIESFFFIKIDEHHRFAKLLKYLYLY